MVLIYKGKEPAYYTYRSYKIEEEINRSGMKVTIFNIGETLESLEIRGSKKKKQQQPKLAYFDSLQLGLFRLRRLRFR